MSNPARSLSVNVDWQQLLRNLGTPSRELALPAQVPCPICHVGIMTMYADHLVGGQWHHCPDCGSSGDMIELASQAWKLSIPAAVVKLRRAGFDLPNDQQAVNKYVEQHVHYRRRLTDLWREATQEMTNPSGELQRLLRLFNLRNEVPKARWEEGPGSLLGGTSTEKIERTFAPQAMEHADVKGQRSNPSAHAIFRGPGWRNALTLPFFDLPGRICGFLFVGRDGKYPDDVVYRRANIGPRGNQYRPASIEAGLAMHPQVLESSNDWGRVVVATAKPMTGLALQMRHLEQSHHVLPLASWYDSLRRTAQHEDGQRVKTSNAWQILGNRRVIFWMPNSCVATMEQAIGINGLVSTVGPRTSGDQSLQEYVWKYTPRDLMRHIIRSAKPWPEVLSQSIEKMDNTAIERHMQRMQVDGVHVERELKKCARDAQRRVQQVFDQAIQRTANLVGGKTVVERAGKWYAQHGALGQESLICDGILRIDRILNHPSQKTAYARGRIICEGRTVKYCEPLERLEKGGLRWMQDTLIQRDVGYMTYDPAYQRHLVDLARVFCEPELQTAVTAVGWDDTHRQFVFPHFALDERGDVVQLDNMILDRPLPAQCLRPPESCLSPEELDRGGLCGQLRDDHAELGRLAATSRPGDPRLADAHDRIRDAERRVTEIDDELVGLDGDLIDEAEVAAALADFDAVWDCLAPREQARVIELLVERVAYDGDGGNVSITIRPSGIKTLAGELRKDEAA